MAIIYSSAGSLTIRRPRGQYICFKCIIPAREAKPVAPLGPLLGQAGINLMEFCMDFNSTTQLFLSGLELPVIVYRALESRNYYYYIKGPSFSYIIHLLAVHYASSEDQASQQDLTTDLEEGEEYNEKTSKKEQFCISIERLFDVVRIYMFLHNLDSENSENVKHISSILYGYLSSSSFVIVG